MTDKPIFQAPFYSRFITVYGSERVVDRAETLPELRSRQHPTQPVGEAYVRISYLTDMVGDLAKKVSECEFKAEKSKSPKVRHGLEERADAYLECLKLIAGVISAPPVPESAIDKVLKELLAKGLTPTGRQPEPKLTPRFTKL